MNEPQIWTLIGVFAASTFGLLGLVTTLFVSSVKDGFRRVDAQFDRVDVKFEAIDRRFEAIDKQLEAHFKRLDDRLDRMDRDIRTLFGKVFPEAS